ncbi:TPA: ISLre2 family transposase [Streptococcus agalactiae]
MRLYFDETAFVHEMDRVREEHFLKQVEAYDAQLAIIMRQQGYHRIDSVERTVIFTFGEMTFRRNRWRKNLETRYPVDEWLGLTAYMRYSPEMVLHMAKHASKMSYREVCRTIRDAYRLIVTKDAVLKAVKCVGELFSKKERYRFYMENKEPQKMTVKRLYVEGDGVLVKTTSGGDNRQNTDIAHFMVHTGSEKVGNFHKRYGLENKHEIVHTDYEKAKEELLDYLYNHFEITDQTILITNSDNGKGYTKRAFKEIKDALGIKQHEHFWDTYHLNEKIHKFFKPYPLPLKELMFKAIRTHHKSVMITVLDTVESLILSEEEMERYQRFRRKLLSNFKDTKPPKLRGLSSRGIGGMESQHRKVTYRMKNRGMYWSLKGAHAMACLILLERIDQLEELFFGEWRQQYALYEGNRFSAGYANHRTTSPPAMRTYKSGHKTGRWRTNAK